MRRLKFRLWKMAGHWSDDNGWFMGLHFDIIIL